MFFNLNKIDTNNYNFLNYFNNILDEKKKNNNKLENFVKNISYNIKNFGDEALLYYIKKFDNSDSKNINEIEIKKHILEKSFYNLDLENRYILESTKNRINIFHENQKNQYYKSWKFVESDGNVLGQKTNQINSMGFYIPGGKAVYPSSVFMNLVPANIMNIQKKIIISPISLIKNKKKCDLLLASMFLSGVDKVYNMGGAHSIFSLSYGTDTIDKVDKICGPGNIYVALSKKIVYSEIGIDIIAGPSEITIFCNNYIDPNIIALDLFSQNEHDELAQSILICDDINYIKLVENSIIKLLPLMYRKNIINKSLKNKSFFIKTKNISESLNIINFISPEHLIIYDSNFDILKYIKNSGSVFLNKYTSESFGDYTSGVNHVLPTYKNSKFSSPLGIYDFFKKLNFLNISLLGFKKLNFTTSQFAIKENLFSHSENLILRLKNENLRIF